MERTRRSLLAAGASLSAASLAGCVEVVPGRETSDRNGEVVNIAHAAGKFLRPENTVEGVLHSIEVGADVVEIDLLRSADDRIVVIHDTTVDRTTDGEGRVDEMTVEELKQLDAGYAFPPPLTEGFDEHQERYDHVPDDDERFRGEGYEIPTLVEVFEAVPNDYPLLLDVKRESAPPERLRELLEQYDRLDSTMVGAFQNSYLEKVRETLPEVETGLGGGEGRQFMLTTRASENRYEPPAHFLFAPNDMTRASFVERAHRNGLDVWVWTVNPRERMVELVEMGADGVLTDDPVLLGDVIDEDANGDG